MNIPNILTMSRILMIVFFVICATLAEKSFVPEDCLFPMRLGGYILAILAGLTDLLDGYLARKWHQITDFGALMDPLADKIFVTATMLLAVEYRLMPAWIAIAVLCREFMVTGLRTLAAKKQIVISADRWGKLKTALQMVMLALAGAAWVFEQDGAVDWLRESSMGIIRLSDGTVYGIRLWHIWMTYLCGIVLVTIGSGAGYFFRYRALFMQDSPNTGGTADRSDIPRK